MKRMVALLLVLLFVWPLVGAAEAKPLKTVTLLGTETLGLVGWEDTQKTESWKEFEKLAASFGLELSCTVVPQDQYPVVLQAYIAAGDLPDFFQAEVISPLDRANLIDGGLIRPIDDLLALSNGTASWCYTEGWMKDAIANNTYVDGKIWYMCDMDHYASIMAEEFNSAVPNYMMLIRQDWLDELGLAMPATLDELFDTLVAFNENDMNGDGIRNERLVLDMRTVTTRWGGFFDSGLAQWFGLSNSPFQMNRATGKVDVPYLMEGFTDYINFMKRCVEAGVLWQGDDAGKQDTVTSTLVSQDVVSMYYGLARTEMAGKPAHAVYAGIPAIQGSESAEIVTANTLFADLCYDQFGFSASGDIEAQAALLDLFCSREYGVWYYYGQEGITFEINENGAYEYLGGPAVADVLSTGYGKGRFFGYGGFLPNINIISYLDMYKGEDVRFASYEAFLASPYYTEYFLNLYPGYEARLTLCIEEAMRYLNYLPNNDTGASVSICTIEQAETLDMYESELYTYMDELNAQLINGAWPVEDLEAYIEEMRGLGLQECTEVYQALYDVYNKGFGKTFE